MFAGGSVSWRRRAFLQGLLSAACAGAIAAPSQGIDRTDIEGMSLVPWRRGQLDIHHIATGRGDASLIVAPDGTSIMIDAGAVSANGPFTLDLKPNDTKRPGEWIARYAARHLREAGSSKLDYLLVTHIHPDHIDGVSDVAARLPIGIILDRGAPDYANVDIRAAPFAQSYIRLIQARLAAGDRVARLRAGTDGQITLAKHARAFADFKVRNIAVNGEVWTGRGHESRPLFPPVLKPEDVPDENVYSAALRLAYGEFTYFVAGDLTSNTLDGDLPWRDVEGPAAQVAGPVDVAVASHHGLLDGTGANVVRALRPRVWLIDVWHVSHPSMSTLERLFSQRLYPGPRDVFATGLSGANGLVNERLTKRLSSSAGHVIIRVAPGGGSYRVVVTDNADESDRVVRVFGPYQSGRRSQSLAAPGL